MVKRCQRCSPVVIDLLNGEEDGDGKENQEASEAKAAVQ